MPHPVDRSFQDRHIRAQSERDHGGVVADDAAADDDDASRGDARHSTEEQPATAERLLEEVRAGLRGKTARDLAHRSEQRKGASVGLDRLVGDRRDSALHQRAGERLVGRDVEIGEEHEALPEALVLRGDRLLDLEQEVGFAPHLVDGHAPSANGLVGLVGKRAARPRAAFHEDLVAALRELERTGRRQRDPVLVLLDLGGDADLHRAGDDIRLAARATGERWGDESARFRHGPGTISSIAFLLGFPPGTGPD